jgi:glucose-1-phosphate adenylyltransferase
MSRVAAIILGGGAGTRLFPLTLTRCKPAISFGGRYRLIDVPISNSINSGCHKIFVITQFLSSSLHQHIFRTYRHDIFNSGFLELLSAEQKPSRRGWFEGTADAVRQNIEYFLEIPVDYFLILSGDQLYTMDYREMVDFAKETDADAVVATLPVSKKDCSRMGIMKIDRNQMITDFIEKPQDDKVIESMRIDPATRAGIANCNPENNYLASMGIYLFKREVLLNLLAEDPREDFGKHLLPTIISKGKVGAYVFNGYWEDIGTIDSFYHANIALTAATPQFDCYDEAYPIYATRHNLPGPKVFNAQVTNSILCEGSIVDAAEISRTILGPRTIVKEKTIIRDSYVMGNDYFTPPIETDRLPQQLHIGRNCLIRKAIIDKNACIGDNVQLTNEHDLTHYDGQHVSIRDGVIIVPRGATVPDGFIL